VIFAIRPEQVRISGVDEASQADNRFTGAVRDFPSSAI